MVRQRSAKPLYSGSNPDAASNYSLPFNYFYKLSLSATYCGSCRWSRDCCSAEPSVDQSCLGLLSPDSAIAFAVVTFCKRLVGFLRSMSFGRDDAAQGSSSGAAESLRDGRQLRRRTSINQRAGVRSYEYEEDQENR